MSRLMALAVAAMYITAGCADTPAVEETRHSTPGAISKGESITVVSLVADGGTMSKCLVRAIDEAGSGVDVVPSITFRNTMFPWFEPATMPRSAEALATLMQRPFVRERLDKIGVRYVVAIGGRKDEAVNTWGGGVAGPRFGAALGGLVYAKQTNMSAFVLDLKKVRRIVDVQASASSSFHVGVIILIPYVYFSRDSEEIACEALAKRIVGFLKGDPPPKMKN